MPVNARELLAILLFACAAAHEGGAPERPPHAVISARVADAGIATAAADAGIATAAANAGVAEDAPCTSDADCGLTSVEPGACCPMLCTPRAVTRKRADELEARTGCGGKAQRCPEPLCQPPRQGIAPACEAGRCVARVTPVPGN